MHQSHRLPAQSFPSLLPQTLSLHSTKPPQSPAAKTRRRYPSCSSPRCSDNNSITLPRCPPHLPVPRSVSPHYRTSWFVPVDPSSAQTSSLGLSPCFQPAAALSVSARRNSQAAQDLGRSDYSSSQADRLQLPNRCCHSLRR